MFILLSFNKTSMKILRILILMLFNMTLFGKPAQAIKCYRCTCWADCIRRKNLFHEMDCPSNNACLTRLPTRETENYIAKQCWQKNDGKTEDRNMEPEEGGRTYKYCYTDFCNDEEAGGITNPNPNKQSVHHQSGSKGNGKEGENDSINNDAIARGKITGWVVPSAMIMACVGCWLIN